ncbi:MAG: IS110 family transposase, partial [Alphaproteobacteria bacterium]|nr:IS110 family transposase [Alphaproteobacteria bacterium]
ARKFASFGHEVRLMNPQYVKPYVKTNKNDFNDSEAICEAVTRPNMRFVAIKSVEQQDIQALHRIRQRVIQERTALVNQMRGLLLEYGIVIPQGINQVRKKFLEVIDTSTFDLTSRSKTLFIDLYEQLKESDHKVLHYDKSILKLCRESEVCQRLTQVQGVGPLTATALVAAIGEAKIFKSGRQMSAWLGLVPRQCSSGGKQVLLGISKRGDRYLRSLLIHGARAVVKHASRKLDSMSGWIRALKDRRGFNKACVAVANKNARILWAIMAHGSCYQAKG